MTIACPLSHVATQHSVCGCGPPRTKVFCTPKHVVRVPELTLRLETDAGPLKSKHILNAQVSIRAPCCKQWFDCPECHAETQTHQLTRTTEMAFICKKCKKAFRKDMSVYEESDEYCPHCDNHYVSSVGQLARSAAVSL
jgi:uncharacterized CHY-type Zn-finger protein